MISTDNMYNPIESDTNPTKHIAQSEALLQGVLRSHFWRTKPCRFWQQGRCSREEKCSFAHGSVQAAPPDLTKTGLCKHWLQGYCPLSHAECPFAHGKEDLRCTSLRIRNGESGEENDGEAFVVSGFSEVRRQLSKDLPCLQLFQKGRCRRGKGCAFSHDVRSMQGAESVSWRNSVTPVQEANEDACNNYDCAYPPPVKAEKTCVEQSQLILDFLNTKVPGANNNFAPTKIIPNPVYLGAVMTPPTQLPALRLGNKDIPQLGLVDQPASDPDLCLSL